MSEAGSGTTRTVGRLSRASISAPLIRLAALLLGAAFTLSPLLAIPARAIGANDIYVGSNDDSSGASSCDDPDFSTNGDDEGHINLALDAALAAVDDDGDVIIVCNGLYEYDDSTLVHDADESRYDSITIHAETSGGVILNGAFVGHVGLHFINTDIEVVGIVFQSLAPAIRAEGVGHELRVEEASFYGNQANWGGAISAVRMNVTVVDSVFGAVANDPDTLPNEWFNYASSDGGAIWATSDIVSLVSIQGSTFVGNRSDEDGGAVWIGDAVRLEVSDSTFTSNFTNPDFDHCGGAIALANSAGATITNSTFIENSAHTGGAVEAHAFCSGDEFSTLEVRRSTFVGNQAMCAGGAIEARSVVISDSKFARNSATVCAGGAIAVDGIESDAEVRIERNDFSGNTLGDACCHGGALYLFFESSGTPLIRGNRFSSNHAELRGGGAVIWGEGRVVDLSGVQRNSFIRNTSTEGGGLALCAAEHAGFSAAQARRLARLNRFTSNRGGNRRTANLANFQDQCIVEPG